MTLLLSASCLAVPSAASAQRQYDLEKLTEAIGRKVVVKDQDGTKTKGTLEAVTEHEIVVGNRTLSLAGIREIRKGTHPVLVGTLVGAGVGGFISLWEVRGSSDYGPEVLFLPPIGAGIGAAIGFGMRASQVLYRSPGRTAVAFAPILTNARRGVAGVITW